MNLCGIGCGASNVFVEDPRRIVEEIALVRPSIFIGVPGFYEKLRQGVLARIAEAPSWRRKLASLALQTGAEAARRRRAGRTLGPVLRLQHALLDRLVLSRLRAVMGDRLRFMITGSAPTPAPVLGFFEAIGLELLEAYGLSENLIPVAANRPGLARPGTVGLPVAPNQLRFTRDGEILVKGPCVFSGYLESPSGEGGPDDQGYIATGDLGSVDDDGFLRLTGRKREIIKTSTGRRISPQSLEAALREIEGVEQALVVGDGRKALAALVTAMPAGGGAAPEGFETRFAAGLQAHNDAAAAGERIAAGLVLAEPFTVVDGHLTPSLKLRRSWLEQRYAEAIDGLYASLEIQPAEAGPLVVKAEPS